jgi:hypothetical protein
MKATKNISQPEIIIGETAHASFWKAAKFCRAKCASTFPHVSARCFFFGHASRLQLHYASILLASF